MVQEETSESNATLPAILGITAFFAYFYALLFDMVLGNSPYPRENDLFIFHMLATVGLVSHGLYALQALMRRSDGARHQFAFAISAALVVVGYAARISDPYLEAGIYNIWYAIFAGLALIRVWAWWRIRRQS